MHTERTTSTSMRLVAAALGATIAVAGLGIAPLAFAEEAPGEDAPATEPAAAAPSVCALTVEQIGSDPELSAVVASPSVGVRLDLTNDAAGTAQLYDALDALRGELGLGTLTRDASLEAAAFQRAAESTLLASNVRPDGSLFNTADAAGRCYAEILVSAPADGALDAAGVVANLGDDQRALVAGATNAGVALVRDAQGNTWWAIELANDGAVSETPYEAVADGVASYCAWVSAANVQVADDAWNSALTVEVGTPQTIRIPVTVGGDIYAGWLGSSFAATSASLENTALTWNCSNPAVATVDAFGTVNGVGSGTCTLSATTPKDSAWQFIYDTEVTGGAPAATTVDLASCTIAGITDPFTATGEPVEPTFTVIDANSRTVEGGYTVAYANNVEPGTATVTLTADGTSPAVTGSLTKEFTIVAAQVAVPDVMWWWATDAQTAIETAGLVGTGTEGEAAPDEGSVGVVYYVEPGAGTLVDAGTAVSYAYYGPVAAPAEDGTDPVEPEGTIDLADAGAILSVAPVAYRLDGAPAEPTVSVSLDGSTLEEGTDYTATSTNNDEPTTEDDPAVVTVEGIGAYSGTLSATFQVANQPASTTDLVQGGFSLGAIEAQVFSGAPVTPAVNVAGPVALTEGVDFTVSYADNGAPGTATVTVTGIGTYSGTLSQTFSVLGDIALAEISGLADQEYTGSPLTPAPTVKLGDLVLTEGTDYDLAYSNNLNVGTATVTVTGKGLYTGTLSANFSVTARSIKSSQISPIASVAYNGAAQTPAVTVTDGTTVLANGTDFTVAYEQNTNAGTAHVVVTGTGNYRDSIDTTFVIAPINMNRATVVMPNQAYTGSALTPKPVSVTAEGLTLTEGVDYVIAGYGNNVNVGNAKATLQGTGNFTGTVTADWKIVQQGTSETGTTQTLPKTGDTTNLVGIVIGAVVGVALVGVAVGLIVHRVRSNKRR